MTKYRAYAGRLTKRTTPPTNPVEGDEYYDTTTNSWLRYNGTGWLGNKLTTTSTSTTTTSTSTTTT